MVQQTPGVYINEINAFPNSVVEVATAVPVFIGYTAKANYKGKSLANKPQRITSLKEYETYFGQGAVPVFDLKERSALSRADREKLAVQPLLLQVNDLKSYSPAPPVLKKYDLVPDTDGIFYLYNNIRLFYQNGGGACYIVSIGEYLGGDSDKAGKEGLVVGGKEPAGEAGTGPDNSANSGKSEKDKFIDAINALVYEQEPTMLVCPDALRLTKDEYYSVAQAMLAHCNATQSRVAILDVYKGAVTDPLDLNADQNPITDFRNGVSINYLKYGVSYFPWVHTTVVGNIETTFQNMSKELMDSFVASAEAELTTQSAAVDAATEALKLNPGKAAELAAAKQSLRLAQEYQKLVANARKHHNPSIVALQNDAADAAAKEAGQEDLDTKKTDAKAAYAAADKGRTSVETARAKAKANRAALPADADEAAKTEADKPLVEAQTAAATSDKAASDAAAAVAAAAQNMTESAATAVPKAANAVQPLVDKIKEIAAKLEQGTATNDDRAAKADAEEELTGVLLRVEAAAQTVQMGLTEAQAADLLAQKYAEPDKPNTAASGAVEAAQAKADEAQAALQAAMLAAQSVLGLRDKNAARMETIRLHDALQASNADYKRIVENITLYRNTLPVAAAMAGVYTAVDTNRGVWKAPANVGLFGVTAPTVNLSDNDQARLNVDAISGKSVNAIRPFPGLGVLVWGARTLDGNSDDWRYVNVRRTMIMLEQSIKLAARTYVFEPNDSNTWTKVQSMISSFLFNLWKQGALAGAKPDDAYSVAVGLGTTMTGEEILAGYMNVSVKVAISRPAEFIVLTFQQQMQKS